ncbi:hypothetical protein ILYODFUR_026912 [Ilyodon furcidens]|uniref:Uncharacterized protein n=1 Tax=Ilyodon furcidens TaxID=33524 RepID=A0ABV0V9U9_9TELE
MCHSFNSLQTDHLLLQPLPFFLSPSTGLGCFSFYKWRLAVKYAPRSEITMACPQHAGAYWGLWFAAAAAAVSLPDKGGISQNRNFVIVCCLFFMRCEWDGFFQQIL